jgi:signal peptidase I
MRKNWSKEVKLVLKGWGYSILVALILATSFKSAVADWNIVPTGSMKPTILEGDRILVNKLAYDLKVPYTTWHIAQWGDPKEGEIVVFNSPAEHQRLVKRVVGVPGDEISMLNDTLFINGKALNYSSIHEPSELGLSDQYLLMENLNGAKHLVMISPHRYALRSFGPITVPEGKYFMMGDNRDNSADSRYFGFVERNRIVGQATAVVASFDIHHHQWPRWGRFFSKLH